MLWMKMMIEETYLLYSGCVMFLMPVWESELISSSLKGEGGEFLELFRSEVNGMSSADKTDEFG